MRVGEVRAVAEPVPEEAQAVKATIREMRAIVGVRIWGKVPPGLVNRHPGVTLRYHTDICLYVARRNEDASRIRAIVGRCTYY